MSWTHHRAIMRVGDPTVRAYYLHEAAERGLGAREIEREIRSCAYERVLKASKLNSRDIGQMDTYRRMYDVLKKPEGDNPTIGILLGTEVDETDVKYSIMSECQQLFATKLMPYMPTKAELQFEIERVRVRTSLRSVRRILKPVGRKGREPEA